MKRTMGLLSGPRADSGFWSLADQGVVSFGNFLTNIFLARMLAPNEYGTYAILLGVLLVIYGAHGAMVTYPLSLLGASESRNGLRVLTAFSLWLTTATGLLFGTALIAVCWVFGKPSLGFWAAGAIFSWIAQETLRRGLMAQMRFRDALWGDAISYLGQATVVFVLARIGRLSIEYAFGAIAVTSIAAAGLQFVQMGIRSLRVQKVRILLGRFWKLGQWMVLSNFTGVFSVQFFPWVLAWLRGAPMAGAFQALANVVAVTNPVFVSVANLIIPASAKASSERGANAAYHEAVRYGAQGALFVLPYLVLVLLWPRHVLSILYRGDSIYATLTTALCIFAAVQFVNYIAVVLATLLNALQQSRTNFSILMISALVSLIFGIPLMIWKGLLGATATMALGVLTRTALTGAAVRKEVLGPRADHLQFRRLLDQKEGP